MKKVMNANRLLMLILAVICISAVVYPVCIVGFSSQNKQGFRESIRVSDDGLIYEWYPVVATDGKGGVYVAWFSWICYENEIWSTGIHFAYSHDWGESWSSSAKVNDDNRLSVWHSSPSIAVDQQNEHIYVTWWDNRTGKPCVYVSCSVDRGASFGTDVKVNDNEGGMSTEYAEYGTPYVVNIEADNSNVYEVWQDDRTNPNFDIYFAASQDGGQSFGQNVKVNPESHKNNSLPWITTSKNGTIYVVYTADGTIFLAKSLNKGAFFEPPSKVNDDEESWYRGKKEVKISNKGDIYVVWTDGRAGHSEEYGWTWDIYFALSFDGGQSFCTNIRVNDDRPAEFGYRTGQGTPSMAIDSNDGIHIFWEDLREQLETYYHFRDIYYAYSSNPIDFSKNVKINYVSHAEVCDCADPNVAIDSANNLFVVWSDTPHDPVEYIHSIYFTKKQLSGTGSIPYLVAVGIISLILVSVITVLMRRRLLLKKPAKQKRARVNRMFQSKIY
ncbi:exo-alpha-sialidase [Candidatus Bathyarchaeota archaeon]|nr:exo-alpha-sialidase [Candidatus Bathyarchaeota archaeon]